MMTKNEDKEPCENANFLKYNFTDLILDVLNDKNTDLCIIPIHKN